MQTRISNFRRATVAEYENFNAGTNGGNPGMYGSKWMAQSFTVNATAHSVTYVSLLMYRYGDPGTLTARALVGMGVVIICVVVGEMLVLAVLGEI
jgi:hypothetical protein